LKDVTERTRCCIAGGGPAGMMLGVLLARAGVDVVVLEKHADFLRDFRGDTIHPSTLEVMYELGILDEFLKRPHQELSQIAGQIGGETVIIADFSHLPTKCKFIAFMPQWDFLDFLADYGRGYPTFHLKMEAEAVDLLRENDRIVGVRATTTDGLKEIRADLVVGADGRHSIVRERAGLTVDSFGAPIDVLWFRLSRRPEDGGQTLGRILPGRIMVMLNRDDYWQCAFVISKGQFDEIKKKGLESFRRQIATVAPFVTDRVEELRDWSDIKLLTVLVDRLREWYRPGLLCIGDAAHAMSPIAGVGINLAIQDAVAAANILASPLSEGGISTRDLQKVQSRRLLPTRLTQRLQVFMQDRVIRPVLSSQQISLPWPLKLLQRWPFLRRIPARSVGIGFRAEQVKSPDSYATR
jgi:2-polyprenyl-6-methoxyphenol hydroxylase-like FAD-dependent oxidoreductase